MVWRKVAKLFQCDPSRGRQDPTENDVWDVKDFRKLQHHQQDRNTVSDRIGYEPSALTVANVLGTFSALQLNIKDFEFVADSLNHRFFVS